MPVCSSGRHMCSMVLCSLLICLQKPRHQLGAWSCAAVFNRKSTHWPVLQCLVLKVQQHMLSATSSGTGCLNLATFSLIACGASFFCTRAGNPILPEHSLACVPVLDCWAGCMSCGPCGLGWVLSYGWAATGCTGASSIVCQENTWHCCTEHDVVLAAQALELQSFSD